MVTHWGLSGPAVLKLSAWGARELAECGYEFDLRVNWTGTVRAEDLGAMLDEERKNHGTRKVTGRSMVDGVTRRLWQSLCTAAGIGEEQTWARMTKEQRRNLIEELTDGRYAVCGKSLNKDEFVTCGGVRLKDVNLKTMESKLVPGVFFAGEVLDIQADTGGYNLQAAFSTGHLAGPSAAETLNT